LRRQFSSEREPNLEIRLFQLMCLASAFLALAVVVPVNYFQDLPLVLNLVIIAFGLLSLVLYGVSLRGHHGMKTFATLVGVVLNLCWFADAGSQGSIAMFFFVGVMITNIFFRGRLRWLFLGAFVADVVLLFTLDFLHPRWAIPFATPMDRYLDLVTGFLVSVVACVLMLWVVLSNHDEERQRLTELNGELQQNLAEIRTLQGLLPICGWCKKIRNDEGLWTQVEHYLAEHTEASFTHGLCPECAREHFQQDAPGRERTGS
jgi:hypothetical protein